MSTNLSAPPGTAERNIPTKPLTPRVESSDESASSAFLTNVLKPWTSEPLRKTKETCNQMLNLECLLMLYKCMDTICSFATNNSECMKEHIRQSALFESFVEDHLCPYCNKTCSPGAVVKHIESEHAMCNYQCKLCFFRAHDAYNIVLHHRYYHGHLATMELIRLKSNTSRSTQQKLMAEVRACLRNRYKELVCTVCFKGFDLFEEFFHHIYAAHVGQTIRCQGCLKDILKYDNYGNRDLALKQFTNHMLSHQIGLFECIYCSFACDDRELMNRHLCDNHSSFPMYCIHRAAQTNSNTTANTPRVPDVDLLTYMGGEVSNNPVTNEVIGDEKEVDSPGPMQEVWKSPKACSPSPSGSNWFRISKVQGGVKLCSNGIIGKDCEPLGNSAEKADAQCSALSSSSAKYAKFDVLNTNSSSANPHRPSAKSGATPDRVPNIGTDRQVDSQSSSNLTSKNVLPSVQKDGNKRNPSMPPLQSIASQSTQRPVPTTSTGIPSIRSRDRSDGLATNDGETGAQRNISPKPAHGVLSVLNNRFVKFLLHGFEDLIDRFTEAVEVHARVNVTYPCGIEDCRRRFRSLDALKDHSQLCYRMAIRSMLTKPIIRCGGCGESMKKPVTYCSHLQESIWVCFLCCYRSCTVCNVVQHMETEHKVHSIEISFTHPRKVWDEATIFLALPSGMSQIEKRERILQIIAKQGGTQPMTVPPRGDNIAVGRTKLDVPQNIIEKPNCGDLYSCGYCQYRGCTSKLQLSKHILQCEDSNDLAYPCAHCSKVLDRSRNFEQIFDHLFYHGERLYRCSRCSFVHYRRAEVTKHLETVHAGTVVVIRESSTTWSCNMCGERSPYRQEMMDHFYQTHLLPGERYMCTLCDKSYFDDKFFVSHFQLEHPGEKLVLVEMYKPVETVGDGSRSEPVPIVKDDASKQQRLKVKVDSHGKDLVSEPRLDGQLATTETSIKDLKTKDHPESAAPCTKKDAEKCTAATGENERKDNAKGPHGEPQDDVPLAVLLSLSGYSVTKIPSFPSPNDNCADKGKALPSSCKLKKPKSLQPELGLMEERERSKRKQKLVLMTDPAKEPRSDGQPAAPETSINDLKAKTHTEPVAPCTKKDAEKSTAPTGENEPIGSAKGPQDEARDDVPLTVLLSLSGYSVTNIASFQSPDGDNGKALPSSSELKNPKSLQPELVLMEERERSKRKQKLVLMTDPVKEPRSNGQPVAPETSINDLKAKTHTEPVAPCTKKDAEKCTAPTGENEPIGSAKGPNDEPQDDVPLSVLLSLSGYSVTKIASFQPPDGDNGKALPSSSELKNPKSLQPELSEKEPKLAPSLGDSERQNVAPAEVSISTADSDKKHESMLHQGSGDTIALTPSPCAAVNRRISRRVALRKDVSHQWSDCTRFCCYHCNLNVDTFGAIKAHKCRAFADGAPKSGPLLWKFLAEKETPRAFRLVTLLRCFYCSELGAYSELAEHVRAEHVNKPLVCIDYWNSFKCGLCTYLNGSGDEKEFSEHFTQQHATCNTDFNPDFPLNDEFLSWAWAFGALPPNAPKKVDIARFMCHLCHVHSASETTLGEHMAQHLFSFVCPDCRIGFRELKVLYEHVTTVHARNELMVAKNFEFSKCYDQLLDFQAVFSNGLIMSKRHLMATSVSPSIEKLYTGIQHAYTRQRIALDEYKTILQLPLFGHEPETCEMFLKRQLFYPRPVLERLDDVRNVTIVTACGTKLSKRVAYNRGKGEPSLYHKIRRLSNGSSSSYEYNSD